VGYCSPGSFPSGVKHTLKLVLDTTQAQWKMTAFVDSTQINLGGAGMAYIFPINPTNIRYAAMTASSCSISAAVDNFTLSVVSSQPSQTSLISDAFNSSGALNGTTPGTTVGGAQWVASASAASSGGVLTLSGVNQTDSLDLGSANYFSNNPGVYGMSMDITLPGGSSNLNCFGLGFVANPVTGVNMGTTASASGRNPNGGPNGGTPWMYIDQSGQVFVNIHDGTYVGYCAPGSFPSGVKHTLKLVLDTTQAQWKMTAFVDSTQINLGGAGMAYTFPSNPTNIRYAAMTASSCAISAAVDNFTLTVSFPTLPALQSDSLVDSIGLNVNCWNAYLPTGSASNITSKLTSAGVRHVRDWMAIDKPAALPVWQLLRDNGIHLCFTMNVETDLLPMWGTALQMKQYLVNNNLVGCTELLEGPNEPNGGSYGSNWAPAAFKSCSDIYTTFRGDPATSSIPILAPAFARTLLDMTPVHNALGDISAYVDYGTCHPYQGGMFPTANLVSEMLLEPINVGSKPMIVTETGYHNFINTSTQHPGASETAIALYLPRVFLEFKAAGVVRTYWFNLNDNFTDAQVQQLGYDDFEAHFGLVRYDFSEKPAYAALKNLIAIMADSGAAFTPTPVGCSVSGSTDVKTLLFQKRNGTYLLAIWRDVSVWDVATKTDVVPASANILVRFAGQRSQVNVFFPTTSSSVSSTYSNVSSVQIPLNGQVAIVQF